MLTVLSPEELAPRVNGIHCTSESLPRLAVNGDCKLVANCYFYSYPVSYLVDFLSLLVSGLTVALALALPRASRFWLSELDFVGKSTSFEAFFQGLYKHLSSFSPLKRMFLMAHTAYTKNSPLTKHSSSNTSCGDALRFRCIIQ